MIRLNKVNKYYNKKKSNEIHVINNTSIELGDKGLVTFLGNSGCGKTTLLNAIGGLDKVDGGEIFIDDEKITTGSSSKKDDIRNANVGYIFQNFNLIEDETVFNNVAMVLRMAGIKDKQEIDDRVMFILKRVGIDKYRNRPAKMLSGGERQRVGIARAIVKNPKIVIADEPTGNLDSKNTIEIMNIIKAISREKLVILVTHERDIAEFYASRVIEIVDGRIVSDKESNHDGKLDYRLENEIYLKDLPVQQELEQDNIKVQYYSDDENRPLNVKIVIKNNNIYVKTDEKLAAGSEAVQLIDDNYKQISKDIYEEYEFDYNKVINSQFKPRYTPLFNAGNMITAGFKKVFSYSILKKILLLGFVLASMFVIYAASNVAGITNVTDDKFVSVNKNYLSIKTGKLTPDVYEKFSSMENIDYVLPGDSNVSFNMPIDDYYQTYGQNIVVSGSLSDTDMLSSDNLIEGQMPTDDRGVVLDKLVIDKMFEMQVVQQIGIDAYKELIGRNLEISGLEEFTITGITDMGSPSIYAAKSLFTNILCNSKSGDGESVHGEVVMDVEQTQEGVSSYNLIKDNPDIELSAGSWPEDDYEALIPYSMVYEKGIGATLDAKVNGKRLTVSGYYSDKNQSNNSTYVNDKTALYDYIGQQTTLTLSPKDKEAAFKQLSEDQVKVTDTYEQSRKQYVTSIRKQVLSAVIVCLVMLIISLIEMYLMLRSSFLSRIKEVGVLRAIGLKKKDIYKMFSGEILAMTTLTAIPAMALMAYILNGLSKIEGFGDQFLMNPAVFLASLLLVYVFNFIAGLLPVFNTLRKTPAEILARNDIN